MVSPSGFIEQVGVVVEQLEKLGFQPVLIGGMALVILGSRRVTRDFDFLIQAEGRESVELTRIFYAHGFELASKLNQQGDVVATIDNSHVASARLKMDSPDSAHFFNRKTGLRIDLLFDFPFLTKKLALRAKKKKIKSYFFRVASRADLIRLKEVAKKKRSLPSDSHDLEFLQTVLK